MSISNEYDVKILSLQEMLEQKSKKSNLYSNISNEEDNNIRAVSQSNNTKAKKNASLNDFITMAAKIISKVFKNKNTEFMPDEGAIISDPAKPLEKNTILWKLVSREPHKELKTRVNEQIVEKLDKVSGKTRTGTIWSQRHDCIVQFDIVASNNQTANEILDIFEDTMFSYTGYFKKFGVVELLFEKAFTDKNLDNYRQNLSVRSIRYFLVIEKQSVIFDSNIEDITQTIIYP